MIFLLKNHMVWLFSLWKTVFTELLKIILIFLQDQDQSAYSTFLIGLIKKREREREMQLIDFLHTRNKNLRYSNNKKIGCTKWVNHLVNLQQAHRRQAVPQLRKTKFRSSRMISLITARSSRRKQSGRYVFHVFYGWLEKLLFLNSTIFSDSKKYC